MSKPAVLALILITVTVVAIGAVLVVNRQRIQSADDTKRFHEVRLVCDTSDVERPCRFEPNNLELSVGSTVRWVNAGEVFHTITSTESLDKRQPSGLFDQSLAGKEETFQFTFTRRGTFHYFCQPHSEFMFGTVEVVPGR